MNFETPWGEKILQVLRSYGDMTHAAKAIEILCKTAEEQGFRKGRDQSAEFVCEGLHDGPPAGLICKRCVDSVNDAVEEEIVLAEKKAGNEDES